MNPSPEHEHYKEVNGDAVKDIANELALDYESYGSTTWRKQVAMAGVEPDNCFYFQNENAVRGRIDIDIAGGDPPPDLALEIDLTSKSLDRFPIYARLGVYPFKKFLSSWTLIGQPEEERFGRRFEIGFRRIGLDRIGDGK